MVGSELVVVLYFFNQLSVHRHCVVALTQHFRVSLDPWVETGKSLWLLIELFEVSCRLTKAVCDLQSFFCVKSVLNEFRSSSCSNKVSGESVQLVISNSDVMVRQWMVQLTVVDKFDPVHPQFVVVLPHRLLLEYVLKRVLQRHFYLRSGRSPAKKRGVEVQTGLSTVVVTEQLHCLEVGSALEVRRIVELVREGF